MVACSDEICGVEIMRNERTSKNIKMDEILSVLITTNKNDIKLTWKLPEFPNGYLLYSTIKYGLAKDEPTDFTEICIPYNSEDKKTEIYDLTHLADGKYKFQVQATSSAGCGRYTNPITVEIGNLDSDYKILE